MRSRYNPIDNMSRECLIEWLRFELETETFDRQLPGSWFGKVWCPFDRTLSVAYAAAKRDETKSKLRSFGYEVDTWGQARRHAQSLSFEEQIELLAYLLEDG